MATEEGWEAPTKLAEADLGGFIQGLVSNSNGDIMLAWWRQSQGEEWWGDYSQGGEGWSGPSRLPQGPGRSSGGPRMGMDETGRVTAVWTEENASRDGRFVMANRFVPGEGWSQPSLIGYADWVIGARTYLAVAPDGTAFVAYAYEEGDCCGVNASPEVWVARFEVGMGWDTPRRVSPESEFAYPRGIAVSEVGTAIVVWAGQVDSGYDVFASVYTPEGAWQPPTVLTPPGAFAWFSSVAMDAEGNAFVVWADDASEKNPIYAVRFIHDSGWQEATKIGEGSHRFISVDVDANGHAFVFWEEIRYCFSSRACEIGAIYANRFGSGLEWEGPVRLTPPTGWASLGFSAAVGSGGSALATWLQLSGTEATLGATWFDPDIGWEGAVQVGPTFPANDWGEALGHCCMFPQVVVVPGGDGLVAWSQPESGGRSIWTSRVIAPDREVQKIRQDLRETQDTLEETQDTLAETQDVLANTQQDVAAMEKALEEAGNAIRSANGALADSDRWMFLLFALQIALATSTVILFGLYWNQRRANPAPGRTSTANLPGISGQGRVEERSQPWPRSTGPLHLSTKERILLHLLDSIRYRDAIEVAPDMMPSEISRAVGINPRHLSQSVLPLRRDGLVEGRTARVRGILQRRKVYDLTDDGKHLAEGIRDRIRSVTTQVRGTSGMDEMSIGEAVARARGNLSTLEIVYESILSGTVELPNS